MQVPTVLMLLAGHRSVSEAQTVPTRPHAGFFAKAFVCFRFCGYLVIEQPCKVTQTISFFRLTHGPSQQHRAVLGKTSTTENPLLTS